MFKRQLSSASKTGINALDLIDSTPVSPSVFTKAIAVIQSNYGTEYSPEKIALLFDMIHEEKWSEERFTRTLKWFLKHKRFSAWTIADWFDYGVKVYPYSWYLEQVNEFGKEVNARIEWYQINGVLCCRYSDGETLPFDKV